MYAAIDGAASACVISFVYGFTFMTAMLIEVQLAADACPAAAAGTIFALIMATSNFGSSLGTWAGGHLYEHGIAWWGHEVSFLVLLVVVQFVQPPVGWWCPCCRKTCWIEGRRLTKNGESS